MVNMSTEVTIILGDLHTPQRSVDIPAKFKELIVPGKAQHVVCTGNFGDRLDWLKSLGGTLHITRGDYDEGNQPESKVFTSNGWKIGVIHGHQIIPWNDKEALSSYQRILDCDILVSGHSHILSIEAQESKYYINPGSLTGSYSSTTSDVTPSFLLLFISPQGSSVYSYELAEDNLLIKRTEITKLS